MSREYFDLVTHQRTGERFIRWTQETSGKHYDSVTCAYSKLNTRALRRNLGKVLDRAARNPYSRVWFRTFDNAAYQTED